MGISTDFQSQAAIDTEIAGHQRAILALRTRRNTYSAIAHLPIDILSLVFYQLIPPDGKDAHGILGELRSVCRHWNEMLLNTPWLWSHIYVSPKHHHLMCAVTMLERCKRAPLSVKIFYPELEEVKETPRLFWEFVATVFAEITRFESLDITCLSSLKEVMAAVPAEPHAPMLHTLKLSSHPLGEENVIIVRLFRQLPSFHGLQTLEICNIRLPETLPYTPQLRNLSILSTAGRVHYGTTVSWLLKALPSTPNLYILKIHQLLPEQSARPPNALGYTSVKLESLRTLDIIFTDLTQSILFDHLEFPSTTAVKAYFLGSRIDQDVFQCLLPISFTISRFVTTHTIAATPCRITIHLPTVLRIDTPSNCAALSVSLPKTLSERHLPLFINLFSSLAPIAQHVTLSATPSPCIHPIIPGLLRSLPNLETVCFSNDYKTTIPFLLALMKAANEATLPCLGLRRIEFTWAHVDPVAISFLEDLVLEREEFAAPIEGISVLNSTINEWKEKFEFSEILDTIGR